MLYHKRKCTCTDNARRRSKKIVLLHISKKLFLPKRAIGHTRIGYPNDSYHGEVNILNQYNVTYSTC